ncbi:MAG: site-specific integrase [Oscillospiraceae bacterium]|nr:site-specific integrase [Oscillospiraceae bacterium]
MKNSNTFVNNIDYLEKMILNLTLENKKLKNQNKSKTLFSCFMIDWLNIHKFNIDITTYNSYKCIIDAHIIPYFKSKKIYLEDITPLDIQNYYSTKSNQGLSNNSILKHHANIRKALDYAYRVDIISYNPADKVIKPKKEKYTANFLDESKIKDIIKIFKETRINIPVLFACVFGLRRSEALGLKWENIDIQKKIIHIKHCVVNTTSNNKTFIIKKDKTKNKSSNRILKIPKNMIQIINEIKSEQLLSYLNNKANYKTNYLEYICIDKEGNLIKPDYLTRKFKEICLKNNICNIRFHDLRHSCASILFNNGYNLKDIQEWLGHSTISTTGDIYTHIDTKRKLLMADSLNSIFEKEE